MGIKQLLQIIDFDQVNEYEELSKNNWVGFANVYLERCKKESKTGDEIDFEMYAKLVELDAKLGVTSSEQLFLCLRYTTRWDIIKVRTNKKFIFNLKLGILSLKNCEFFQIIDFEKVNEYELIRKQGWVGFSEIYLNQCNEESKIDDQVIEVYTKLGRLDARLGTTASEQLFKCLFRTTRPDLIKVRI